MTPKEQAQNLIDTFISEGCLFANARKCAIVCVNKILLNFEGLNKPEYCAFDAIGERKFTFEGEHPEHMTGYDMVEYWEEVKTELENKS